MASIVPVLGMCAALVSAPCPQVAQRFGDVLYTHEVFGSGRHLLRLSTGGNVIDLDDWRRERMHAFAESFAAETCRSPFRLSDAANPAWPKVRAVFARQFVFRCISERPRRLAGTRGKT